jgi:outer membrane protein assembly factor BamB
MNRLFALNPISFDPSVVVKRDMAGNLLSVSPSLQGEHAGSPVVSDDGNYVFLTHNSPDKTTGYFTILNANLGLVVTRSNAGAFAPPGIYHSPEEGFYDAIPGIADGVLNTNDLIMWSLTPEAPNVPVPVGLIFGFQFAIDFDITDVDALNYFNMGSDRAFQTITPPVITNKGRSVYWSTSRSEYFGFIGNPEVDRARFNRNPNLRLQFEQNSQWSGQPIFSTPAVSTDENGGAVVFGGSASNEFFRFTHFFNGTEGEASKIVIATTPDTTATSTFIVASPVIDPLARAVYYVESDGTLHQANYDTIEDIWTESIPDGVQGEMSMNADGSILYVMSVEGRILALGVAERDTSEAPPVTSAPSIPPVMSAPAVPSATSTPYVPTVIPPPSVSPVSQPSDSEPSMSPVAEPTTGDNSIDATGDCGAFTKSMQLAVIFLILYAFLL